MARYFDPPEDYRPGLAFQLRERKEGGDLQPEVRQSPPLATRTPGAAPRTSTAETRELGHARVIR
ncbi:hypothetical protein [Candidatus Methylomirabilis limnetica]|uniref:hypothetical protein n=1 Tax=Candidatus Methylomirabilis limnetica TaxID=2033718 RepID=UPI001057164C|nr:hypothetical protein [Candidatus Methylomirabilis limnetica]